VRIAINTRFLLSGKMEGFGWYTYEVTKRIVQDHPEHEFYFFFDREYDSKFVFSDNVTPVILRPAARHPLLFIWWFELMVRKAMKKYKIDLFYSPDGYLSLGSDVPQIATIHDINFEHHPKDLPLSARIYLRSFFPRFAKKAKHVLTVSHYSKSDICQTYGISEDKVTAIWNGVSNAYGPLDAKDVALVRNKYTLGEPYFIFVGALHPRKNVVRLIEAFILFKAQTTSSNKLVIVGASMWQKDPHLLQLADQLGEDLIFTGHVQQDELIHLVGSAYALTYVPYYEGFGIPIIESMKCGVPVIAGNRTSLPEVAGDAALLCDPFDTQSICNAMIRLTSEPALYDQLRSSGIERSKSFDWDITAQQVWTQIERVLKKQIN
jgi:glycosyltransferase involved in cell wall biosynthesis